MKTEHVVAGKKHRGFTLIDLVVAIAIVVILTRIALPSYQAYVVRSSRQSAQGELVALANAQEKIFLNSSAYSTSVSGAYTGLSSGGLGVTGSLSKDKRYAYSITATATTFTLTAAGVTGTAQSADGNLTINEQGVRTWAASSGTKSW